MQFEKEKKEPIMTLDCKKVNIIRSQEIINNQIFRKGANCDKNTLILKTNLCFGKFTNNEIIIYNRIQKNVTRNGKNSFYYMIKIGFSVVNGEEKEVDRVFFNYTTSKVGNRKNAKGDLVFYLFPDCKYVDYSIHCGNDIYIVKKKRKMNCPYQKNTKCKTITDAEIIPNINISERGDQSHKNRVVALNKHHEKELTKNRHGVDVVYGSSNSQLDSSNDDDESSLKSEIIGIPLILSKSVLNKKNEGFGSLAYVTTETGDFDEMKEDCHSHFNCIRNIGKCLNQNNERQIRELHDYWKTYLKEKFSFEFYLKKFTRYIPPPKSSIDEFIHASKNVDEMLQTECDDYNVDRWLD